MERERDSEEKATEDRGKDWSDVSTSQGTLRIVEPPEAREEAQDPLSLGASRGNQPCPHPEFLTLRLASAMVRW